MDLVGDRRGQSIQIGAVLLFGVLIIAFASYQAFVVPNQNRGVEFNHNEQVQRDMVEVRNTLLETYSGGTDGYAEVTLGTRFPPRLLATNPSAPSGRLRTTDERPIVISAGGTDITEAVCPGQNITTRFIEYSPNYAEYGEAGTIRYESSVVYNDFGGTSVPLTGQTLVSGERVQIIPITESIDTSGTKTVAVEPRAGRLDTTVVEDVNVTLPTQLSESSWETALEGEVDPANVTVTSGAGGRNVTLELGGERRLECGPVGIGETPDSGSRSGGVNAINPAAPGDIRLVSEVRNKENMTLTFNNTAGVNNITEARINFYESQGGGSQSSAIIREVGEPASETLDVGGPYEVLSPKIRLEGDGSETQVRLTFDNNVNQNDWFILSIQLETGETALYFISGA